MSEAAIKSLPDDIDALKALLAQREKVFEKRLAEKDLALEEKDQAFVKKTLRVEFLEEYIRLLKYRQYGASSERYTHQADLFNEGELLASEDAPLEATAIEDDKSDDQNKAEDNRTKKKPGRRKLPNHLPRIKIYHELDENEQRCDCGCQMTAFDDVISEQLGVIPAELYVIQHCRKKYVCKDCEGQIKTAPLPPQPIPKSNATPELLAFIIVSKLLDGLPLYRQEKMWNRVDIDLPRATMANWMMRVGNHLVQPLINLLKDHLLAGPLVYMDETRQQVLKELGKSPTSESQLWVQAGGSPEKPVHLFHYDPSKSAAVAIELLGDFKGYLLTDDYRAYDVACKALGLIHVGCNDHARRKFDEALGAHGKKSKGKVSRAQMGLNYYSKLYAIERQIKNFAPQEKYRVRQEKSVPLLKQFKAWIDKTLPDITPTSNLGKALHYTHRLWPKLTRYCDDGVLDISNQVAENSIRPFAIARKNFLFFDTPKGAQASANLYSLIMTAKANNLEPMRYLAHIFKELPGAQTLEDIEVLLPWNVDTDTLANCLPRFNTPVV